jgi:PIN domain nuclease of toxin-antitoxin system
MNLLLDTHVLVWALELPAKMGSRCRAMLKSHENVLFISTVSAMELGQLVLAQKLSFRGTVESWLRRGCEALDIKVFDIDLPTTLLAYSLPGEFHKDPADRLLVAAAIHHGYTLVTADERILAYSNVVARDARK